MLKPHSLVLGLGLAVGAGTVCMITSVLIDEVDRLRSGMASTVCAVANVALS